MSPRLSPGGGWLIGLLAALAVWAAVLGVAYLIYVVVFR